MLNQFSIKPYLVRAVYNWCIDYQYTPYVIVQVNSKTMVPRDYVQDGNIVLDISNNATNQIVLNNEAISFQARFQNNIENIFIPIDTILAIYSEETGLGINFKTDNSFSKIKKISKRNMPKIIDNSEKIDYNKSNSSESIKNSHLIIVK